MAQAVFEEGPLEQYLRDAGEVHELLMPGISQSIIEDIDIHRHLYAFDSLHETGEGEEEMEWRPHCLIVGLNLLETFLSSTRPTHAPNPFVERFKYTIISSSLLSTSLSSSHQPATRSSIGSIPGNLKDDSLSIPPSSPSSSTTPHPNSSNHQPPPHYAYFSLAALAAALLLSFERRWLATLSLGGLSFLAYNLLATSETPSYDFTPTINALDDLVEANRIWESTVQDSIQTLEKEEATLLRSPTSAPSPSSNALRVAVHSALQTTRTQCDNVRQLFSALTCPSELSQLSEMYAPPSPVKSPLLLPNEGLTPARPYSYPSRHQFSPPPVVSSPENKRATWSGSSSYTGLTSPVMSRRREKHRSNLSVLFQGSPTPSSASASTPITPFQTSPGPSLAQIAEDLHHQDSEEQNNGGGILLFQDDTEAPVFGSAALDLQKQRKAEGYGTFELSPPAIPRSPPLSRSPNRLGRYSTFTSSSAPTTTFSSSRFTTFSSPAHHPSHRHPLSLYALNQALLSALSSRRYTCSHLLALRFNEEDGSSEEGREYWENVKSVVELLTTTFADESARLAEALEEVERQHLRDANPTPDISGEFEINRRRAAQHNRVGSGGSVSGLGLGIGHSPLTEGVLGYGVGGKRRTPSYDRVSFAPMPSHLSRFAAHVAAISTALEDAREQLEECVAALKEENGIPVAGSSSSPRSRLSSGSSSGPVPIPGLRNKRSHTEMLHPEDAREERVEEEHRALQAYERLRRELGLALRECERGRQKLVDLVNPPPPPPEDEDIDVPPFPLTQQPTPPLDSTEGEGDESLGRVSTTSTFGDEDDDSEELGPSAAAVDDLTSHLLNSSEMYPLMGPEKVYEADTSTDVGAFTRERSKLSREERIKRVRERREKAGGGRSSLSGLQSNDAGGDEEGQVGGGRNEKWGPGGEVVQELKDVIWKVSERRRKMLESHLAMVQSHVQGGLPVGVVDVGAGEGAGVGGLDIQQPRPLPASFS